MNVIISCHIDTVFRDPMAEWKNGLLRGAVDNFSSVFACGIVMERMREQVYIEFTEDEEMHMDGARNLAKRADNSDTLFIVMDVTQHKKDWSEKISFTIENIHRIEEKHVVTALKPMKWKYKINPQGAESEAWLYKDMGFACIEVDIPVKGGLHSLDSVVRGNDIFEAAKAIELIVNYFKDKNLREVSGEI